MRQLIYTLLSFFALLCTNVDGKCQTITGGEYFINTDPGVGNGTAISGISGASTVNTSIAIPSGGFPVGFNLLYIRVRDQNNNWSIAEQRLVYVDNSLRDVDPSISAAEYFTDSDPGVGNGTAFTVTSGSSVNTVANINTVGLNAGFHQLFIRVKDQNKTWAIAEQKAYYISSLVAYAAPLAAAEYFMDTDPGVGNGTAFPITAGNTLNIPFNINTGSLISGFHQLFIRVKDQNGSWSIAEQRVFYKDNLSATPPLLNAAEYFLDTDPGVGNGTSFPITNGSSVSTILNINTTNLAGGFHQLFIRMKDQNNIWGIAEQRSFYNYTLNALSTLATAEYFLDTDPGVGNAVPFTITGGNNVNSLLNINSAALSNGFHQLFVRMKDQNNDWGIAEQRAFYIEPAVNNLPIAIVAAEYFVDTDTGFGNNTPLAVIKGNSIKSSYGYVAHNLAPGQYTMNARVQDSLGHWSNFESQPFTVSMALPVTLINFKLDCNYDKALLSWQTASETNSNDFEVQKSADGVNWTTIAKLVAAGSSSSPKDYQYTDQDGGASFYRLLLVDRDGTFAYSPIIKGSCATSGVQLQVYPLPAKDVMHIYIKTDKVSNASISLVDMYGKTIQQVNKNLQAGTNIVMLDISVLAAGEYFLKVQVPEWTKTQKVIIQH